MSDRPLGVQIAHMLRDRGVRHVFGIPGVHNIEMYRGIEEAGLIHVLARHEQGVGFMADGYARASGEPGVAFIISGPGLTNIMTPMGQAYSDSVPMMVISSCLDPQDVGVGKGKLHEMLDQETAAGTVCAWSQTAYDAPGAYRLIDKALTEFATKRPRPVHLQVPIAVLGAPVPPAKQVAQAVELKKETDWAEVATCIGQAQKPLIIVGGGAVGASDTLRALASHIGAASFSTYAGRGVMDAANPLHFGAFLARPGAADIVAQSDLVLVFGSALAEGDLWRDILSEGCPILRFDIDAEVLSDPQNTVNSVSCDLSSGMDGLIDALGAASVSEWSKTDIAAAKTRWRAEVEMERSGILPVAEALRAVMPNDALIYSDMTQFAYAAKEVWDMPAPGLWHHPTGFGTLGYALPAAIGGKVAVGDRPVVAIAGDYGFQYTIQELATAVELKQSLPILIWDNDGLGEIEDTMARAQIAPMAVTQLNPDFLLLAKAYGAEGVQPDSLDALQSALLDAFKRAGPTVIRMRPGIA
jgi:5-guanidino-2-oxopentanoate decarboxylase